MGSPGGEDVNDVGHGENIWGGGGGGGAGGAGGGRGQLFTMPKMYKRASQSLIDLHTIETKEKKRQMEEEARAEEDMELEKLREKERAREKRASVVSIVKERDKRASVASFVKEREKRASVVSVVKERVEKKNRSEDDKIKEDGDEDVDEDDDEEAAAEKRDQFAVDVQSKVAGMGNSPITPMAGTATIATTATGHNDDGPPAFSSIATSAMSTAALAATKKQNRMSTASHYLRRRRSMPMYDESSEPPPYPSFAPHPSSKYNIMPREDEGRERLPPYTNPIYLKAIMPRKMEFSAPGEQAKDRKWRRVMCVLEGTALKVYKCPAGHAGVGVLGEWWEKQVGAGDVSLQPAHTGAVSNIHVETRESRRLAEEERDIERQIRRIIKAEGGDEPEVGEDGAEDEGTYVVLVPPPLLGQEGASERTRRGSGASLTPSRSRFTSFLKPGHKQHARSKSDAQPLPFERPPSPRPSLNIPRSGMDAPGFMGDARSPSPFANGSGSMRTQTPTSSSFMSVSAAETSTMGRATPASSTFSSFGGHQLQQQQQPALSNMGPRYLYTNRERDFLPDPGPEDLMRVYTLQNAESGIGNDYSKRKNVIRLRLDGEQFLLQARDVTGVVEWIEVWFRLYYRVLRSH
jgi:hypothetical protein